MRKLLLVKDYAEHVGVSTPTVYRWIRTGAVAAYKRGGTLFIDVDASDALLHPVGPAARKAARR